MEVSGENTTDSTEARISDITFGSLM